MDALASLPSLSGGRQGTASLSVGIRRTVQGIVVTLGGRCRDTDLKLLERLLLDLVEGQGNGAVSVDFDGLDPSAPVGAVLGRVAARARDLGLHFALDGPCRR